MRDMFGFLGDILKSAAGPLIGGLFGGNKKESEPKESNDDNEVVARSHDDGQDVETVDAVEEKPGGFDFGELAGKFLEGGGLETVLDIMFNRGGDDGGSAVASLPAGGMPDLSSLGLGGMGGGVLPPLPPVNLSAGLGGMSPMAPGAAGMPPALGSPFAPSGPVASGPFSNPEFASQFGPAIQLATDPAAFAKSLEPGNVGGFNPIASGVASANFMNPMGAIMPQQGMMGQPQPKMMQAPQLMAIAPMQRAPMGNIVRGNF
jgi:hypothetical protein